MRRLVWQVYIGQRRPLWESCLDSIEAYCERHGFEHRVLTEPVLRIVPLKSQRSEGALRMGYLPIFEKFNAWALLHDFDEIAVIDADVYAKPDAPSIFDVVPSPFPFAAAIEREMPLTEAYAKRIAAYAQGQYGTPWHPFRNMGVTVLRPELLRWLDGQTPEEFIRREEFEPFVNGEGAYRWATEQTLTNTWLERERIPVFSLPWQFNCMYGAVIPEAYDQAHLIHFFNSDKLSSDDPEEMLRTKAGRARV